MTPWPIVDAALAQIVGFCWFLFCAAALGFTLALPDCITRLFARGRR